MDAPIKVGIIRCDTHGAYFAPLMAPHDPLKLQRPADLDSSPPYSWMCGGAHFYFYHNYANPRAMTVETVEGFEIVKVWDEHRVAAEALSEVMDSHPSVCTSFEQVSDGVDLVLIGDCNGDGSDHLEHATPGLEKGVATYIDKPLANSVADVKKILALSKEYGAPVFSGSILRHIPGAAHFARRMGEIGGASSGSISNGSGGNIAGLVHAVSLAQAVFGNGISQVHASGPGEMGMMHLAWSEREDRPSAGVTLHPAGQSWHCSIHVAAFGPEGGIMAHNIINDWYFPYGAANILKLVKKMVLTGAVDDSMNDMIEAIAVIEAGRLSYKEGGRAVKVSEVQ